MACPFDIEGTNMGPDGLSKDFSSPPPSPKNEECSSTSSSTDRIPALKPRGENNRQAWLTIAGSSLVYFASFGIINSFGFFQSYYERHLLGGTPASTISLVGTLQLTLMNLLAAPAGSLFDCYGLKALYLSSGVSCAGALLCLSFVQSGSLWQILLVQGVFLGIAIAFGAQPALVVVCQHFVRRRGLVLGIVAASGSVGGVCFPVIFAKLANTPSVGFAWSLRVGAVVVTCCYAVATLISSTKGVAEPLKSWTRLLDFGGFLDRRYAVLAIGAFLAMLGQFIPYYYIGSYMTAAKPSSLAKDYLLPLMNASSFMGRTLGGLAADVAGPANTVYPMTMLSGLLCLGTWAVTSSIPVLVSFVCLYGFCSGVFIAVLPAIIAQLAPVSKLGGRIGAFYSVCAIAQLIGSPIGGALIQSKAEVVNGGYGKAEVDAYLGLILFAGLSLSLGGVFILWSRLLHDRRWRARC